MVGMRDTLSLAELKSNVVGLARTQNGETVPEIKEIFADTPIHRRTGIVNCYEDPSFRRALEKLVSSTGRRHIIIAAVTIGTCCALPTLSMLNDGYHVHPVVDACGAWSPYEAETAMSRMANAGAELATTFALACELQADWKLPSATAMIQPFLQNLPEYVSSSKTSGTTPPRRPSPIPSAW